MTDKLVQRLTRVMIVDDDPALCTCVVETFAEQGISVEVALNAQQCLFYLRNGFSGIILMDICMPVMNGWDTIRAIVREDLFHNIIILMVTAELEPDEKEAELNGFIFDYIVKPFDSDTLIETVVHYMLYL